MINDNANNDVNKRFVFNCFILDRDFESCFVKIWMIYDIVIDFIVV